MTRSATRTAVLAGLCVLVGSAPAIGQQTVGLLVNESPQEGFTLICPSASNTSYLVSNDGLLVSSWTSDYRPGEMGYLRENGKFLRSASLSVVDSRWVGVAGTGGRVEEYDWEGNLVWYYEYSAPEHISHHDIEPMPSGNVLLIAWELVSEADALAAGKDPATLPGELWADHIIEVQPTPPIGGNIVWEWHAVDHVIQDFDVTKDNFGIVGEHPELIDYNFPGRFERDWLHFNGVAYNAELDQIVVSPRRFDEIWVIDHGTTTTEAAGHTGGTYGKGGDLLYRWGNPAAYRRGTAADKQLFGQHDPNWVPAGSPGEGNLVVFSNGANRPDDQYSSVEEIAPPVDQNGFYAEPAPGQPFAPASPVWTWTADPPSNFYQSTRSGAHRLPNGNTLISASNRGQAIEVDADGDVVWRYENPIGRSGTTTQGVNPDNNGFFKLRRYPADFPGFTGLDMTPGDPIELFDRPYPILPGSLIANRDASDGSTIGVFYDALGCPSWDFNLIYGALQDVSSYTISGADCSLGLAGSHTWTNVPAADLFFLVVGTDELAIYESSWARTSEGAERFGTKASFQCGTTTKVVSSTCP